MIEHPAKGLDEQQAFVGKEVEGVLLLGVVTVILRSAVRGTLWDKVRAEQPKQVFLTEQFRDWQWVADTLLPWAQDNAVTVTAGREASDIEAFFELPIAKHVRLVARVWNCDWHKRLRMHDEVSIGNVYDMTTFLTNDGHQTRPSDYIHDKTIQ